LLYYAKQDKKTCNLNLIVGNGRTTKQARRLAPVKVKEENKGINKSSNTIKEKGYEASSACYRASTAEISNEKGGNKE